MANDADLVGFGDEPYDNKLMMNDVDEDEV